MKPILLACLLLISSFISNAQDEYKHPDFKKLAKSHKKIAVLPWKFRTELRDVDMKDITQEDIEEMQKIDGQMFQNNVYEFFIKKELSVEVQDVNETNKILAENGIDANSIGDYKHKDLAAMLDVDAMVSGNFKTKAPMSEEASVAIEVLSLGALSKKAHEASGVMRITDRNGTQLWRYSIKKSTNLHAKSMITNIMKKSARNIPYM